MEALFLRDDDIPQTVADSVADIGIVGENEILEAINMTGIGPMGLGGRTTALGVNIEYAHRHPASYPVAVAFNCWAARRATVKIDLQENIEYM